MLPLVVEHARPARPVVQVPDWLPAATREVPVWRRVCSHGSTTLRGRDPGTTTVDSSPSGEQPADSYHAVVPVTAMRSTCNEVRRSLVVSYHRYSRVRVVIRGNTPRGRAFEISRECPPFGAEPPIVVPLGTTIGGSFPTVTSSHPASSAVTMSATGNESGFGRRSSSSEVGRIPAPWSSRRTS